MNMDTNTLPSSGNSDPVRDLWQQWIAEHPLGTRQKRAAALALLCWVERRSKG